MKYHFFFIKLFCIIVYLLFIKCQDNEDVSRVSTCLSIVKEVADNKNFTKKEFANTLLNCFLKINDVLLERIITDITENKGIILSDEELEVLINTTDLHKKYKPEILKYAIDKLSETIKRIDKINEGKDDYKEKPKFNYNFKFVDVPDAPYNKKTKSEIIKEKIFKYFKFIFYILYANKKMLITVFICMKTFKFIKGRLNKKTNKNKEENNDVDENDEDNNNKNYDDISPDLKNFKSNF